MMNLIKHSFSAWTVTALLLGGTLPGVLAQAAADSCCKPGASCCKPGAACCAHHQHPKRK